MKVRIVRTACVGEKLSLGIDAKIYWVLTDGMDLYTRVYTFDNRLVMYDVVEGMEMCNEMASDVSEVLELIRNELELALEEEMRAAVIIPRQLCCFRRPSAKV